MYSLTEDEEKIRSIHEAGHAIAAWIFGWRIGEMYIADTDISPPADINPALFAWQRLVIELAGPASERLSGSSHSTGIDRARIIGAVSELRDLYGWLQPDNVIIGRAEAEADQLLIEHDGARNAVAAELLRQRRNQCSLGCLTGDEIRDIIARESITIG